MADTTFVDQETIIEAEWLNDTNETVYNSVINVKHSPYGAVGDGVTDDTSEIQAAIDAVEVAGGGIVFLPAGTYFVSTNLLVDSDNVCIMGAGRASVIKTTSNINMIRANGVNKLVVKDISFLGNSTGSDQDGIRCINCTDGLIHNVHVKDVGHDGILLISGCNGMTISDCHVDNADDDGINIGGDPVSATLNTTVSGCVVENVTNDGIHISDNSEKTTVIGNVINACGYGIGMFKCLRVSITGNTITNTTNYSIQTNTGPITHVSIIGNSIDNGNRAININAATHLSVTGNTIRAPTAYGIVISFGTIKTNVDIAVSANQIDGGCSTAGIFLSGCKGVSVVGNSISDVSADGIYINSDETFACADIIVSDNIIRDPGDEGIEVEEGADSEHLIITRNIINSPTGRGIEYRGGPYFSISENHVIDSSDFGIVVAASTKRDGRGLVEGNIIEGGCTSEGLRITNYDDVLTRSNVIFNITGTTGIGVSGTGVAEVIEGNLIEDTISSGSQGILVASAPSGSSLGTLSNKVEIFDKDGTSVGFIPVYDAIT